MGSGKTEVATKSFELLSNAPGAQATGGWKSLHRDKTNVFFLKKKIKKSSIPLLLLDDGTGSVRIVSSISLPHLSHPVTHQGRASPVPLIFAAPRAAQDLILAPGSLQAALHLLPWV